jgi:hypothetical protein
MRRRRLFIGLGAIVLAVAAAVAVGVFVGGDDEPEAIATPTTPETFVWDVSLDPSGRPYDVFVHPGVEVGRRPLAVLHAPSRRIQLMGGEYLATAGLDETNRGTPVTLDARPGRRYPVHAIWQVYGRQENTVAAVIVERNTPVVRWETLDEIGYVTDGGTGGITTYEWAALPKESGNPISDLYWAELVQKRKLFFLGDADGHPGTDTIAFSNGWGDGRFPAIAGYDSSGGRAAIVLWSSAVPWRLAFPEGTPPAEVTQRENDFAACIKGLRLVEGGPCRVRQQ